MSVFKRCVSGMLALILLVACFAGCEGSGGREAGSVKLDPQKYKGQTLVIWHRDVELPYSYRYSVVNRKFNKLWEFEQATGVKIKHYTYDALLKRESTQNYLNNIQTGIASGKGPDIFFVFPEMRYKWLKDGLMLPLNDYMDFSKPGYQTDDVFSKTVSDFYTYNNKTYVVNGPEYSDRLYYNKDLFKKYNLPDPLELYKKGEWTWDKFALLCSALTKDTDGDGKTDLWGYASYLKDQWFTTNGVSFIKTADGKPKFDPDSKAFANAVMYMGELEKKRKAVATTDMGDVHVMFYNGQVAMCYYTAQGIVNMKGHLGSRLGIVPFPMGPDYKGNSKSADTIIPCGWAISSKSQNPQLAALFLEWMRSSDSAESYGRDKRLLEFYGDKELAELQEEMRANAVPAESNAWGQVFEETFLSIDTYWDEEDCRAFIDDNRQMIEDSLE